MRSFKILQVAVANSLFHGTAAYSGSMQTSEINDAKMCIFRSMMEKRMHFKEAMVSSRSHTNSFCRIFSSRTFLKIQEKSAKATRLCVEDLNQSIIVLRVS